MKILTQSVIVLLILSVLVNTMVLANGGDTESESTRPDSHAPLEVMGDHAHGRSEWMLSYRFMAMRMEGLRDGTESISIDEIHGFTVIPVKMNMQMHMFGAMFAPHDRITLMAMTSYRDNFMEMEAGKMKMEETMKPTDTHGEHADMGESHGMAASHGTQSGKVDESSLHDHESHAHPVGAHEMESSGIGDLKLSALISLLRTHDAALLINAELSVPTGSIEVEGTNGLLPYPMQLGSGSFELMPGVTFTTTLGNWSLGGQARVGLPLNKNSRGYRLGHSAISTFWGARRLNDWVSVSLRALFENWGNIEGSDHALNPAIAPTMDPRLRGGTRGSLLAGSNLIFPDRLGGPLAGQRFAFEVRIPVYQHLDGPQLELDWSVVGGWQYAFTLW